MNREDFENVPCCEEKYKTTSPRMICDSLVILPIEYRPKNSSGFGYVDVIAVRGEEAVCRYKGGVDMLNMVNKSPSQNMKIVCGSFQAYKAYSPADWAIDFLPISGLVRIHPLVHRILCVPTLTTLMLYPVEWEEGYDDGNLC